MTKEFWINLPVKDVKKSKIFFTDLGFSFNPHGGNGENSACLLMGNKNIVVMLFEEPLFKGFTSNEITNTRQTTEVLLSFDAESRTEVDEIARKVTAAGGAIVSGPGERQEWMYGFVFSDIDGHRWNVLHMDMTKMPKG
ncbi:MAG TPA: VOC family protein [Ohtaekwangia sp.]|uniref:VOC family protein n=1 Tax=Ohtaekwangia sp. TaxID=2066019 RepID=UPI002F94C79F